MSRQRIAITKDESLLYERLVDRLNQGEIETDEFETKVIAIIHNKILVSLGEGDELVLFVPELSRIFISREGFDGDTRREMDEVRFNTKRAVRTAEEEKDGQTEEDRLRDNEVRERIPR